METNLKRLWNDAVITKETYEWLKPLHDQETADLEEIKAAAEERKNNPFYQDDDDDSDSDSSNDDEHGNGNGNSNGMMTTSTKTIKGIEGTNTVVSFVTDSNSSGHGDKVWHASIATCRYLKERFLSLTLDSSENKKKKNTSSPFRCLELGAGTAVPSFFLAQMLLLRNQNDARIEEDNYDTDQDQQQQQQQNIILRITDAKVYRNVMQILRSVELQESPTKGERCVLHAQKQDSPLRIEVHPHNWGDDNISFGLGTSADDQAADDSEEDTDPLLQHDLVIVSDCIYNPEFHDDLLISLSRTLALPTMDTTATTANGGVAVVSFSLHGNVQDSAIWDFLDQKLPSTMRNNIIDSEVVAWRLHAKCVSTEPQLQTKLQLQTQLQSREEQQPTNEIEAQQQQQQQQPVIREGWNMESTMIDLGMVTEGMQSERWLAYVYEITWVEA